MFAVFGQVASNLANGCFSVKSFPWNGAQNIHMIVYRALGGLLQATEKLLELPERCIVITSQGGGMHQHWLQSAFVK